MRLVQTPSLQVSIAAVLGREPGETEGVPGIRSGNGSCEQVRGKLRIQRDQTELHRPGRGPWGRVPVQAGEAGSQAVLPTRLRGQGGLT